jgi:hypothetical protein
MKIDSTDVECMQMSGVEHVSVERHRTALAAPWHNAHIINTVLPPGGREQEPNCHFTQPNKCIQQQPNAKKFCTVNIKQNQQFTTKN